MKRLSIVLFFLLLGAGIWGWVRMNQPEEPMLVTEPLRIHQGVITGGIDRDNPEIQVFNGIPFATARRWAAPSAPPQWGAIVRDTRAFGAECLQPRDGLDAFVNGIIDGVGMRGLARSCRCRCANRESRAPFARCLARGGERRRL